MMKTTSPQSASRQRSTLSFSEPHSPSPSSSASSSSPTSRECLSSRSLGNSSFPRISRTSLLLVLAIAIAVFTSFTSEAARIRVDSLSGGMSDGGVSFLESTDSTIKRRLLHELKDPPPRRRNHKHRRKLRNDDADVRASAHRAAQDSVKSAADLGPLPDAPPPPPSSIGTGKKAADFGTTKQEAEQGGWWRPRFMRQSATVTVILSDGREVDVKGSAEDKLETIMANLAKVLGYSTAEHTATTTDGKVLRRGESLKSQGVEEDSPAIRVRPSAALTLFLPDGTPMYLHGLKGSETAEHILAKAGAGRKFNPGHFELYKDNQLFSGLTTMAQAGVATDGTLRVARRPLAAVTLPSGSELHVFLDAQAAGGEICDYVKDQTHLPMKDYQLLFNGLAIKDDEPLAAQGVPFGATLTLQKKPMLTLRSPLGVEVPLDASLYIPVADVKELVAGKLSLPLDNHQLAVERSGNRLVILEDDKTLSDQSVVYGDTLVLQKRPLVLVAVRDEIVRLDVSPDATVGSLKKRLEEVSGLPAAHQRLTHEGRALMDDSTLAGEDVPLGAKLVLEKRTGVSVVLSDGRVLPLEITPDDPVRKVQMALPSGSEGAAQPVNLTFKGQLMKEVGKPLSAYGVKYGDQIIAVKSPMLTVMLPDGSNMPLDVDMKKGAKQIRDKITEAAWLPAHHYDLEVGDLVLSDEGGSLEAQGVQVGDSITLKKRAALILKTRDGRVVPLYDDVVGVGDTVSEIKAKLAKVVKGFEDEVMVDGDGKFLNDDLPLSEQGVMFGSTLQCITRPLPPQPGPDTVDIKAEDGTIYTVIAALDNTIGDLKEKLGATDSGINPNRIALTIGGKAVPDVATLRILNVPLGSTLEIAKKMGLRVKLATGDIETFDLSPSTKLAEVRLAIADRMDLATTAAKQQVLFYGGSPLPEEGTLAEVDVPFGGQIEVKSKPAVVIRLPDGSAVAIEGSVDQDTVGALKARGAVKAGQLLPEEFVMQSGGVQLNDEQTLTEQGVAPGAQVDLVKRPSLTVKLPDKEKPVPVFIDLTKDPVDVKRILTEKTGLPVASDYQLQLGGDRLEDGKSLKDQGVASGGVLEIVPRTLMVSPSESPLGVLSQGSPEEEVGGSAVADQMFDRSISAAGGASGFQRAKRLRRRDAKQLVFADHLTADCNLANDGPRMCAKDPESYGMIRSYEKRRNAVTLVFVSVLLLLGVFYQLMIRGLAYRVDKSNDRFLTEVVETIFRHLAVIMLVIATIIIILQFNFVEYDLDHTIFGDLMDMFPAMQSLFSESHLEMLFEEILLITIIFTAVYIGFILIHLLGSWRTLRWLKKVDLTDSADDDKKFRSFLGSCLWFCSTERSAAEYRSLRYEFQDSVEAASVPGLDPSGYYFAEYLRASLLKKTMELVRVPCSSLFAVLVLGFALFPMAHWRHLKEVILVISVGFAALLICLATLIRLAHMKRLLLPSDSYQYSAHRQMVESGTMSEDLQRREELGPVYKSRPAVTPNPACCPKWWTRAIFGTLHPSRHEALFLFWRRGPGLLVRIFEFTYFLQMIVLSNLFYLFDRHWKTWWLLYGPWAGSAVIAVAAIQFALLPTVVWHLVLTTCTSGMIDEDVLREVWEQQRANTVRRCAQLVDQLRIDATLFEIESGGEPFWRSMVAAAKFAPEVELQNDQIFAKLDDDKDGLVNMSNFHKWIVAQGFTVPSEKDAQRWFEVFDRDANGGLDRREFSMAAAVVKRLLDDPMDPAAMARLLAIKYDLPCRADVSVDAAAMKRILKKCNLTWTDGHVKHFLEYVTGIRGGAVTSVDEFIAKLGVLESETLATLQQAVGKLRNREEEGEVHFADGELV